NQVPGSVGASIQVHDVRAYGARGDGRADDTRAIDAADRAAVGSATLGLDGATVLAQGTVYIPPGTYRHSGLTYRGAPWLGAGVNVSTLDYLGAGAAVNAVGSTRARRLLNISSLTLLGSHAGRGAHGLRLGHNYRSQRALNQIRIEGFPSYGIYWAADSWSM